LTDTRISGNTADTNGGGLYATGTTTVTMGATCHAAALPANSYCSEVRDNSAANNGAGLYLNDSNSTIEQTAFISNSVGSATSNQGSAVLVSGGSAELSNLLVTEHNRTAVYAESGADLTVQHATFAENDTTQPIVVTDFAAAWVVNNIFWHSGPVVVAGGSLTTQCNLSEGAALGGNGDISGDPRFNATVRGDFRLSEASPAVNACGTGLAVDLDGESRPNNAGYDIGAFESPHGTPTAITLSHLDVVTFSSWLLQALSLLLLLITNIAARTVQKRDRSVE
jgi:predicted outer membrane repeat protein